MNNANTFDGTADADRAELAMLLRQFAERAKQRVHRVAAEHDLTPPLVGALNAIEEPRAMGFVADALACDASYVTGLADRLETMGLAVRQADPDDRRVKQLVLTEEGARVRAEVRAAMEAAHGFIPELDDEEVRDLARLLRKILGSPRERGG